MSADLGDLQAVLAVAKAKGFREAARLTATSPSRLSDAVRRAETALGIRLFHRTTRAVTLTEAGAALVSRLAPAIEEVESALDAVNGFRDRPAGTLRLNVPVSAARLILPSILPDFLKAYPEIRVEITADSAATDTLAAGFDAGIRYDELLEQDMIAVPIGPREQRFALVASPGYLERCGTPAHPRDLLQHACIRGRFTNGNLPAWEFERGEESVRIEPTGPLTMSIGGGVDLGVEAALQGIGLIMIFEQWVEPYLASGELVAVLEPWWQRFTGPYLYYSDRRLVPAPLRAFIDFIRDCG
ncbi:LysR family transcriptional regulator [Chromohalobacter israelensis]|uniref:LysR family transcriptional regulator n=1 Tax=Chromohalobacter israelensis TaxID=141390 RepID=UPI000FFE5EAF|nr:LysR family transcriptional regulator [Chromohalobacter salexigens]RXE46758.1 LysR family transcriptional regulator [Chromohalobacter salexigens]